MILNQTQNNKTDAYILLQEVLRGWPSLWSFDPKQNRILSLWETHFTTFKLTNQDMYMNNEHKLEAKTTKYPRKPLTFLLLGETKGPTGKGPQSL